MSSLIHLKAFLPRSWESGFSVGDGCVSKLSYELPWVFGWGLAFDRESGLPLSVPPVPHIPNGFTSRLYVWSVPCARCHCLLDKGTSYQIPDFQIFRRLMCTKFWHCSSILSALMACSRLRRGFQNNIKFAQQRNRLTCRFAFPFYTHRNLYVMCIWMDSAWESEWPFAYWPMDKTLYYIDIDSNWICPELDTYLILSLLF